MTAADSAALLIGLAILSMGASVHLRERRRILGRIGQGPTAPTHRRGGRKDRVRRAAKWLPLTLPLVGAALGWLLAGTPGLLVGCAAAVALPREIERSRGRRRRELLESQLADGMTAIAAALRAGLSLSQAIRFAAGESEPPLGPVLQEVADRETLGVPLDGSLEAWEQGNGSADVRLAAGVLRLHHRVGGEAPVVLDQVARALRHRLSAARELRSLTAQARLSGAILGLLPLGFFLFMSVVARQDMEAAYRSPLGIGAIVGGLLLQGGAFVWVRRLLRVAS